MPEPDRVYSVPVLMYHRVVPRSEAGNSLPDLVVPPEDFSAQMKAFYFRGWHSITLAQLADYMEIDASIPDKTFVITFDDGWYDGYTYAFPILKRYGFVATYFVVSGRIDTNYSLSTEELRALQAAGNEIGNHTENHISLSTVPVGRAAQEVERASEQIMAAVGQRPVSLAYPMGGVNSSVVLVVSQVPGIKIAVTTVPGVVETWSRRYVVPRVKVKGNTDIDLLFALLRP